MQKQVQTPLDEVTVSTPRDRKLSFDPHFMKNSETILVEGVADRIIGLYALDKTHEIRVTVNLYIPQIALSGIIVRSVRKQKIRECSHRIQPLRNWFILHTINIRKKWTMPLANRDTSSQQLAIKLTEQFNLEFFTPLGIGRPPTDELST